MLNICLLTVEDTSPEAIYTQIYDELRKWLFVRKGIVNLHSPETDDHRWVTNVADWRRVIAQLVPENDLVFCTVDLKIPADGNGSEPDPRNGLSIANEIQMRQREGLRCCILTGLAGSEIENLNVPDVLFDFKGDTELGFPSITAYIKSQALSLIRTIRFSAPDGSSRTILLDERSGRVRDHFIAKAPYYVDQETWHVPTLIVGGRGLGRRVFLEFISFLAGAEFVRLDLSTKAVRANRENYERLEELCDELESAPSGLPRRLLYVSGLDEYEPAVSLEPDKNCLWPLRSILKSLRSLGTKRQPSFPLTVAFGASGDSRLRIRSKETRAFIRFLEDCIGEMSDFPLQHLAMDQNGWTLEHPRILRLPSLFDRGPDFITRIIDSRLEWQCESLAGRLPGYKGQTLALADDVRDLMADKTEWSQIGNLAGLVSDLDIAFESFLTDRAATQFVITRAHLSDDARRRFERTVLNMDEVKLELPAAHGGKLLVVERADCHVADGELLVILGPSGCGKSTLLRMFAGLQKPTAGTVSYRGEQVTGPSGKTGVIFQDYSLFPWLTVRKNIDFGPRIRGIKATETWPKIEHLLEVAKLKGFEDVYPEQLSGGMRQRAAIVRSIANDSDVLLMDEPFAALDVQTRWEMQDFLVQTKRATRKTIVFVTHDLDEAVYLADRIYICSPRPLKFEQEVIVPFSADDRKISLRRDPVFLMLVNRVHAGLLAAATGHHHTRSGEPTP